MNETNSELEMLSRATSNLPRPLTELSGDEATLHEGWSALAHLAEAADAAGTFDEQAFLAKLSRALAEPYGMPTPSLLPGQSKSGSQAPRRTWLVVLSTLAASVVICVLTGLYIANQKWGNEVGSNPAVEKTHVGDQQATAAEAADKSLGWDDSLDDHIQYVNDSLFQLESGDSIDERSYRSFGSQLEQFGKQIEVDSL